MLANGSLANHDQVKSFPVIADFEASARARARRIRRPSPRSRYRNSVFLSVAAISEVQALQVMTTLEGGLTLARIYKNNETFNHAAAALASPSLWHPRQNQEVVAVL
jgi:hypothetical protein